MIYVSRLTLNHRSHQAQSEIRSPYEMHRTLSHAFDSTDEAQLAARCLFRIENNPNTPEIAVLVQSRTNPEWERLRAGAGGSYLLSSEVKQLTFRFAPRQQLAFRLRANPTVTHNGKRTGLYGDEPRLIWFDRKAKDAGCTIVTVRVADEPKVIAAHTASSHKAVFSAARFEGVLQVVDPDALLAAVENGIGAAKGFGFGLLSLAKA